MRKLKIAELVFDYNFYPRAELDRQHVYYIRQAMQAGTELPPLVIDKPSKRVVDGFHRGTAYRLEFGEEHEVEVVEKSYANDRELFLDAVRYNSAHGRSLTTFDRTHCLLAAKKMKISADAMADALHLSAQRVGELMSDRVGSLRSAFRKTDGDDKAAAPERIPLKRTISHMAGHSLTKRQEEANGKLSGMEQAFYVNQIIELIESDLIDVKNAKLIERLGILNKLLDGLLVAA